jgi:hypothetical protein
VPDPESPVSDLLDVVKSRLTQFRGNVRDQVPMCRKRIDVGNRQSLSSAWRLYTLQFIDR